MTRLAYAFLIKRPVDKFEWPAVYGVTDNAKELAEAAFGRVTPVVTVDFDAEVATPEQRAELTKAVAEVREFYNTNQPNPMGTEARMRAIATASHLQLGALLDLIEGLLDGSVKL